MGAWSGESLGNDHAADWAADLVDGGGVGDVEEALTTAAERAADDYLEAPEGSEALAAAEVVAAAAGRPCASDPYSEDALAWAAAHPDAADLVPLARGAVDRVAGDNSELRDLWLEDEDDPGSGVRQEWAAPVEDLRRRLAG